MWLTILVSDYFWKICTRHIRFVYSKYLTLLSSLPKSDTCLTFAWQKCSLEDILSWEPWSHHTFYTNALLYLTCHLFHFSPFNSKSSCFVLLLCSFPWYFVIFHYSLSMFSSCIAPFSFPAPVSNQNWRKWQQK